MKDLHTIAFIFGLLALLNACSTRRSEPFRGAVELKTPSAKNGQILFMQNCQKCHPQGEGGLGPALNTLPEPGFAKRFQMRHGLGVMPSFNKIELSQQQLKDISKYLKALKHNKK